MLWSVRANRLSVGAHHAYAMGPTEEEAGAPFCRKDHLAESDEKKWNSFR